MKISAKKPEYLIRIQQSIQGGPWKYPKPKNTLNLKSPVPGFSIPDVGRGGSSVLATSQFHPASGRDFSSSHLAAASVLISAESETHQRWRVETHTEFSAGIMRMLLYHFALHLCYSSQFQQAHKKNCNSASRMPSLTLEEEVTPCFMCCKVHIYNKSAQSIPISLYLAPGETLIRRAEPHAGDTPRWQF